MNEDDIVYLKYEGNQGKVKTIQGNLKKNENNLKYK